MKYYSNFYSTQNGCGHVFVPYATWLSASLWRRVLSRDSFPFVAYVPPNWSIKWKFFGSRQVYWIELCFWVTADKDLVTVHKIIHYYINQFQANVPFPYFFKTSKTLFYIFMGYKNGTLIWNRLMVITFHFFNVVLQFLILCVGRELFVLPTFILLELEKIYLLFFVYIVKISYFPRWDWKWFEKLIFCLSMFNLKQDNFQSFLEKSKSETVISVA